MNDKETYGIELDLITNKFKKKMEETVNIFKKFKSQMEEKNSYKIRPVVEGDDLKTQIDKIESTIGKLFKDKKISVSFDAEGGLKSNKYGFTKYSQASEETKNSVEAMISYVRDMIEALNSGNKELIKTFTITKRGADQINQGLYEIQEGLKEMPTLTSKIKGAFSSIKEVTTPIKSFFGTFKTKLSGIFGRSKKDSDGFGSSITKAFSNGVSSIKRFGVALLGVRGIYGLLTKAVRSYLADHENVANQMNAMISGIGNLLAPAIEYVLSIVSKLLSYVNAFIKMLTGVDLFAKGMESINKSAKKTAKSVNDIKGGLAGIDEITNIATETNNNDNNPTGDVSLLPKVDLAPLEKLKDFLSDIFEPFKKAWEKTKTSFLSSVKNMVSKVGGMFKSIGGSFMEVWTNGTGQKILENIIGLVGDLFDIIGNIGEAIKVAWDYNGQGTEIIQAIADIFNSILEFAREIGDSIKTWTASEGFQTALKRVFTFIKDIFNYVKDICNWLLSMYKKYIKPVVDDALLPALDAIITAIGDIWNAVKPVVDKVVEVIKGVLEPAIEIVSKAIKGIINAVKGVAQFISGVFTQDWEKAWTGIKNIFGSIWDTMKNIIIAPINFMIGAVESFINWVIDAFNGAKKLLGYIGIDVGMTDHVHLGRIGEEKKNYNSTPGFWSMTQLATGTPYVEREGLAYLHQGEAVVPKKFNDREYFGNDDETKDLLRELIETIEDKDLNTYLDGKVIGKTSVDYINEQNRMLGRSVI